MRKKVVTDSDSQICSWFGVLTAVCRLFSLCCECLYEYGEGKKRYIEITNNAGYSLLIWDGEADV